MRARLSLSHPALDQPLAVAGGDVVIVDETLGDIVVAGLLGAAAAVATIDGHRLPRRSLAGRVRRGLAVVSAAPVAPDVTVADHLAAIVGRARATTLLTDAPLLAQRGQDPAGVLSGGERRVLSWLRAIALRPRVVLLDRAAHGLDVEALRWATGVIRSWVQDDVAVVVRPGREEERAWSTLGRPRDG